MRNNTTLTGNIGNNFVKIVIMWNLPNQWVKLKTIKYKKILYEGRFINTTGTYNNIITFI